MDENLGKEIVETLLSYYPDDTDRYTEVAHLIKYVRATLSPEKSEAFRDICLCGARALAEESKTIDELIELILDESISIFTEQE